MRAERREDGVLKRASFRASRTATRRSAQRRVFETGTAYGGTIPGRGRGRRGRGQGIAMAAGVSQEIGGGWVFGRPGRASEEGMDVDRDAARTVRSGPKGPEAAGRAGDAGLEMKDRRDHGRGTAGREGHADRVTALSAHSTAALASCAAHSTGAARGCEIGARTARTSDAAAAARTACSARAALTAGCREKPA